MQEVERLASLLKRKSYQHQPVPSSKRLRNHCRLESAAIHCEDQNVNLFSLTYRLGFFFCMFFHLKTFYYLLFFFSEYFTSTQRNETFRTRHREISPQSLIRHKRTCFSHFTVKQFSFFIKLMRSPFLPTLPPTPTFCLFQR